ncbi:hypothetical protein R3P38DRAFT_2830966 [Favolaschia claudopus]|uniref:Uncharacterized protein n=1 Tax=Favolaschia claudopus TaxID=2862362 RepID=A0AAW0E893_9AGAR
MATAALFSRLQLAAALLEYDNDPDNPDAPYRSAQESAIFANFRRAQQSQTQLAAADAVARKSDYLGVALPTETGSLNGRESVLDGRRSRGSLNILRNPFGAEEAGDYEDEDEEPEEHEVEVDLSSWGIDAFMPKEKEPKSKRRSRSSTLQLPNPHPVQSVREGSVRHTTRSMSVGNLDNLTNAMAEETRRKSFASPLDLENMESVPLQRQRVTSQPLPDSVPFPTGSVRSPSPQPRQNDFRSSVFTSKFDPNSQPAFDRQYSSSSMDPRPFPVDDESGPRPRAISSSSMNLLDENNPFALRPPSMMSKFDPKGAAHARRERRYSTMELLRPKILVMPSPLQSTSNVIPSSQTRDGFLVSADPPLPPGARSTRRSSHALDPSSLFCATHCIQPLHSNPRMNLTLSQLTFRNTLLVDGHRDVTYADIDDNDGMQVQQTLPPENEGIPQFSLPADEQSKPNRPAGKLLGKSLIDDLENRKAEMRSKSRVFTGDERPSMMARPQTQRRSTLIDPASLQARPDSSGRPSTQHMDSFGSQGRRNSQPLLNFEEDDKMLRPGLGSRAPTSRSVFGVDTLWERELAKLKDIEAQEKADEELRKAAEEKAEMKRGRKKRKGKGKATEESPVAAMPEAMSTSESVSNQPRMDEGPPILPAIPSAPRRPPPVNDDSDSEESDAAGPSQRPENARDGWSSEEEAGGPTRTTGTGPRYPKKAQKPIRQLHDDDSEEDLPLAATIDRAAQRATQLQTSPDSDEEQPLSVLLQKTKLSLPSINFDRRSESRHDEDEDDQPLGLRASRVLPSMSGHGGDDDDMPLAYHPEQQRRSQFNMMAQAQAQHQHMMMQAQMHQSMFFQQPMMGSGFFGPPMMMQPPVAPSLASLHDEAKYGAVDKWRRDVAEV